MNIEIEDSACLGAAIISDHTTPGGHSAAGDKEAKQVVGGSRLAVQALEPGAPPPSAPSASSEEGAISSSAQSSPLSPVSQSQAAPDASVSPVSSPLPGKTQDVQTKAGESTDDDDEDCDEL